MDRPCYRCRGRDRLVAGDGERCRARTWSAEALERKVRDALIPVLRGPNVLLTKAREHRAALDGRRVETQAEVTDLHRQLGKVRKARERLLDVYVDERLAKTAYADKDDELKREEETLARCP